VVLTGRVSTRAARGPSTTRPGVFGLPGATAPSPSDYGAVVRSQREKSPPTGSGLARRGCSRRFARYATCLPAATCSASGLESGRRVERGRTAAAGRRDAAFWQRCGFGRSPRPWWRRRSAPRIACGWRGSLALGACACHRRRPARRPASSSPASWRPAWWLAGAARAAQREQLVNLRDKALGLVDGCAIPSGRSTRSTTAPRRWCGACGSCRRPARRHAVRLRFDCRRRQYARHGTRRGLFLFQELVHNVARHARASGSISSWSSGGGLFLGDRRRCRFDTGGAGHGEAAQPRSARGDRRGAEIVSRPRGCTTTVRMRLARSRDGARASGRMGSSSSHDRHRQTPPESRPPGRSVWLVEDNALYRGSLGRQSATRPDSRRCGPRAATGDRRVRNLAPPDIVPWTWPAGHERRRGRAIAWCRPAGWSC
jgi:hypothetical protein